MKTNKKEKRKQIPVNYWLIWGMSSTGILKVNRFLSREEKLWTRLPPINKLLPKSKCYQHLVYFSFKILDLRSTSIKQSTIVFDMFSDSEALIYMSRYWIRVFNVFGFFCRFIKRRIRSWTVPFSRMQNRQFYWLGKL